MPGATDLDAITSAGPEVFGLPPGANLLVGAFLAIARFINVR
jgi:hypothetical protein